VPPNAGTEAFANVADHNPSRAVRWQRR